MVERGGAPVMITALAPAGLLARGALLTLDPAEAHHLQVRRASSGDRVRLVDGQGTVAFGVLSLSRKEARVEVTEAERVPPPAPLQLAVGAGDKERFGWLVEKAAEVGVTSVVPVETERTLNVATRVRPEHAERLARRAVETIKQCGAAWAPALENPVPLVDFLARKFAGTQWLADEAGAAPQGEIGPETVTILVGPEGGLTDPERTAVLRSGFLPVRLGPNTLRFETAALAGAILVVNTRAQATR
ncbi:MAG: 16S rRNA (uracil(1498)-N(3))-methyltransferase [Gemmatimonadales bacterium]